MAIVETTDLTRLKDSAQRFISGFTAGQKAVVIVAVVAAIAVAVGYMMLSGKPTYSVLFSDLQPSDAASITQQLTTDHVPYELETNGATILVPANDVDKSRLTAAAAGLPAQSTVGLTLLTKEGLTTSQITQQADYLRAIQGELEQTIDSISGVASSQVNVAESANQTFALNNTSPTGASVLVTMETGHTLSQTEVQAIVHLVASSVPGLSASNVTVADNSGNLLAGPGTSSGAAAQNTQTTNYDSMVEAKVQSYLTSVFGAGNADVQVNATLTFNKVKTSTHQLVLPGKGATKSFCTSTQKSLTTYTGKGAKAGGAAGTVTTTKAVTKATATTGTGKYKQTSTSATCETSTETKTVTQASGTVVNQSVAVLVNSKGVPKGTTLKAIRKGVAAAANLRTTRGDVLSFTVAPFSTATAAKAAAAAKVAAASTRHSQLAGMEKDGAAGLIVALLAFWVWFTSRRRRRLAATPSIDPALLAALGHPMPDLPSTAEIPAVQLRSGSDEGAAELEQFLDRQPLDVADVLRKWLRQEPPATHGVAKEGS